MNNKHLSWYKEINNNFIIASRAYFLQEAGDTMFYPGSGPLDGDNTLFPAWLILMIWVLQELIYHEIVEAKP